MANNLKKGVFSSILLLVKNLSDKLIGLVSTLILARILAPEDFGIIAIATLVMGLLEALSETGSASYLLKEDYIDDEKVNTAWTLNLILKSTLVVVLIALVPNVKTFYNDLRVQNVLLALTFLFWLKALANPGISYLSRNQNYGKQVQVALFGKVLSVIAAVIAAFIYESYWALVVGEGMKTFILVASSYLISPHRPRFQLTNVKAQLGFSIWMIPQSIAGYTRTQLDTFIVSSHFGQAALGSYHTMKYIAFIPSSHILLPLSWPFLVEIRAVVHDKQLFLNRAIGSSLLLLIICIPLTAILCTQSKAVTLFLLGSQWIEYHYILSLFSLLIPAFVLTNEGNRLLILSGMTKQLFFVDLLRSIIVYGGVFCIGFENIQNFISNFIALEVILAVIYYLIVVWHRFGLSPMFRCFGYLCLFTVLTMISHYFAELLTGFSAMQEIIKAMAYSMLFVLSLLICLVIIDGILKRHSREWDYLSALIFRFSRSVLKSGSNKN